MERKSFRGPLGILDDKPMRKSSFKTDEDEKDVTPTDFAGGTIAHPPDDDGKALDQEDEEILDLKVEREWKNLAAGGTTESTISQNPKASVIANGLVM